MFYDIVTLDPNTYIKKSKKSNDFAETDEFIAVLQKKFDQWNIKYSLKNKVAIAHKLKYDQFEKDFFKQSQLIIYVVSLFSEVGFRESIKKLITTCHDKEKLIRIIAISLDKKGFVELNDSNIDLVHFGNLTWRSEDDKQWDALQQHLQAKLQTNERNNSQPQLQPEVSTLPIPILSTKSSSKIKSFFNSLPTKFDIDKRLSLRHRPSQDKYNESVPNIKISTSPGDDNIGGQKIALRHKEEHSRLSLSSLFRKRSRKDRDSGLSATSSLSNSGDNRHIKNQYTDMVFDESGEPSPLRERSTGLCKSSLEKTKSYRAKIHMFKDRATRYFHSASCLSSPENKRRKNADESFESDALFSSHRIVAFSSLLISDIKSIQGNENEHSEPHASGSMIVHNNSQNCLIKYYSWNEDLNYNKKIALDRLICNDLDKIEALREEEGLEICHTIRVNECVDEDNISAADSGFVTFKEKTFFEEDPENDGSFPAMISNDFVEDYTPSPGISDSGNSLDAMHKDNVDENYFQVRYAPKTNNSPRKSSKHNVTFKIDGLDSLENMIESIQKSCNDMKLNSRSNTALNTFKSKPRTQVDESCIEQRLLGEGTGPKLNNDIEINWNDDLLDESKQLSRNHGTKSALRSDAMVPIPPVRSESNQKKQRSFLHNTTNFVFSNPVIVMGLFTATAITAPVWSTYITLDTNFSQFVYGTVQRIVGNEIIHSLPGQISSVAAATATTAANSLRRLFVLIPNGHNFFNSYRVIYF